ncbi:hypothetical protein M2161_003758 [Streptomyces sp. SAI-133]|nr:hypothetical protein [Streptomyces sp. SAI-133]
MPDDMPSPITRAATAAQPGRSPPSPRTSLRLTGAPFSTGRGACVGSPRQIATQYALPKMPNSSVGWNRSPPQVGVPTPSTSPARLRLWPRIPARSSVTTTLAMNLESAFSSGVATDARLSVRRAPSYTLGTPSTLSVRVSSAARVFPPQSASDLGSSSPLPPRPSVRFIEPGSAAAPVVTAVPASMVVPSAAMRFTLLMRRWLASRSVPTVTTTQPTCCGTPTLPSCGIGSSSTSGGA